MRNWKTMYLALLLLILFAAGCSSRSRGDWTGPKAPVPVQTEPWEYGNASGHILKSEHYLVHTTISDEDVLARLPQVLEGAFAQYQFFASAAPTSKPMSCYVFSRRGEWADFTSRNTGSDAAIYLQITRGGYCIGDWFVSYFVGDKSTYSVAAHEGWHQYVARHFKGRLPPFLEEGTACMFENVRMSSDLPRWDLALNPNRALGLRNAWEYKVLWPLEKLITMHAGDVVRLPGDKIEAFYSQNWAFARYMWDYNDGAYREKFRKLLSDTAAGTVYDPTGTMHRAQGGWSPAGVKPMLEHYLGKNLKEIEAEYLQFVHKIAYEQLSKQWLANPT